MALVEKVGDITPNDYQKGVTKVFLKKTSARLLDSKQQLVLRGGGRLVEDLIRLAAVSRSKKVYHEGTTRLMMIQAFTRGFQERFLLLKRRRRCQCMWGVTCLAFAVRRYQRDRLAARTF